MSLIISIYVNEGIVMASDSRVSFSSSLPNVQLNIQTGHHFDSEEKTFLCPNGVGISSCGDSSINKKSIAGIIKSFIKQEVHSNTSVKDTASSMLTFFKKLSPNLNAIFHVCGFEMDDNSKCISKAYKVITRGNGLVIPIKIDESSNGAFWDGEITTLTKLIKSQYISPIIKPTSRIQVIENDQQIERQNVILLDQENVQFIPEISIPWEFMSLQDAIDFARFAITTTVETMKFANVNKTVGGPIDILVIRPDKASWISHKKLH